MCINVSVQITEASLAVNPFRCQNRPIHAVSGVPGEPAYQDIHQKEMLP